MINIDKLLIKYLYFLSDTNKNTKENQDKFNSFDIIHSEFITSTSTWKYWFMV